MSQEMNKIQGSSYSYFAQAPSRTSRLTSFRGYLGQKIAATAGYATSSSSQNTTPRGLDNPEERQGWRAWAGEKARGLRDGLRGSPGAADPGSDNIESITLFPGWAARKYRRSTPGDEGSPKPFEVEVHVSGFAISYKNRETGLSRSQRAFIRVAKGFAALPKLTSESQSSLVVPQEPRPLSQSTEELLSHVKLPPRPEEATEGLDMDALDRQFRRATRRDSPISASASGSNTRDVSPSSSPSSSTEDLATTLRTAEQRTKEMTKPATPLAAAAELTADTLRRMHANLEERLQPFWSSVLPNRTVRLHLFASPHQEPLSPKTPRPNDEDHKPLASTDVTTAQDGSFQARFTVNWDQLCHHPTALHIAFGEEIEEHTLAVVAELLKPQPLYGTDAAGSPVYAQYQSPRRMHTPTQDKSLTTTRSQVHIPITHCPIRVISDIDDTVKDSGILFGSRAVFHNVFVKDLRDCVVPGMGEWYTSMWEKGVRFHYVSNGPFEYVSVLNEFLPMSNLPPGSIKLRSFAGRSLFTGFFSAPVTRKRGGVEHILKAFPDSRFFLIGDSGEHDMELYAQLASSYSDNILGIFIRDVTTIEGVTDPLEDPTGWNAVAIQPTELTPGAGDAAFASELSSKLIPTPTPAPNPKTRKSYSISSIWRGVESTDGEAFAEGSSYFTSNNRPEFSAEPDNYDRAPHKSLVAATQADTEATPRAADAPTMSKTQTAVSSANNGETPVSFPATGALNQSGRPIITEAPRSTQPLSMENIMASARAPHRPSLSSSASSVSSKRPSSRAQRRGTTSSSASESDVSVDYSSVSLPGELVLPTSGMSPAEKRRNELQMRVWRARTIMPSHVVLRVFRNPEECVEAEEILQREGQ